ncbi:MAG: cellobiose transport system permease protein [Kribbellaceae bacterium]|nr:cellobiose transport system permease protein [Kribbellaceae bacterium]
MSVQVEPQPTVGRSTPPPPGKRRWSRLEERAAYLYLTPFFLVFAVFGLFPMLYTFWVSLHHWELIGTRSWVGLDNYGKLFSDSYFWNAVGNTFGMFLLATIPQFALALLLATSLSRRIRTKTLFRLGVLVPNVTSVAAVAIIFSLIFARDFGLTNWLLGHLGVNDPVDWTAHRWSSWIAISVMVDWRWTGYNALIFLAAMQAVPKDLYEAAEIDGASRARQFISITVPMLRPTIVFASIISIIGGVQLFTEPLLFNAGANAITGGTLRQFQTVTMYMIENAFNRFELGYGAAIAWMVFLLILVLSFVNYLIISRVRSAD